MLRTMSNEEGQLEEDTANVSTEQDVPALDVSRIHELPRGESWAFFARQMPNASKEAAATLGYNAGRRDGAILGAEAAFAAVLGARTALGDAIREHGLYRDVLLAEVVKAARRSVAITAPAPTTIPPLEQRRSCPLSAEELARWRNMPYMARSPEPRVVLSTIAWLVDAINKLNEESNVKNER